MKIRLIDPALKGTTREHTKKELKSFWFPHLSLTMLAGLTPNEHEVQITDENVDKVDFEEDVDLVGLTGMTIHAQRAYEIGGEFRKRGIPVVMGGVHASNLPNEAKKNVDSVVIGEAETVWAKLLQDVQSGNLKPFYKAEGLCSLKGIPHPRQDLLKKAYMTTNCIQTTRGCPFNCSYCSVTQFFGHRYRFRPVEEVVEEARQYAGEFVVFIDDNIVGNPRYAKDLFQALVPLNIKWGSQGSLTMARDNELLKLAAESGCRAMFVGFESLSQKNLKAMNKTINKVNEYSDSIKKIHDHGIMINGAFIFGLDYDDESVFERTVKFVEDNKIELATYHILTPLPGTRFYQQIEKEGRIFDKDWSKYNSSNVVFKPKLMSEETLQNGYNWAFRKTYSYRSMMKRLMFATQKASRLFLNIGYRRMVKRGPQGELSSIASLLKKINESIPVKEINCLIPTVQSHSREKIRNTMASAEKFLHINAIENERARTLTINLEGSLDIKAAKKLIKRVKSVLNSSQEKIILDFSEIKFFSPKAINLLIVSHYDFLLRIKDRIKFRKLHEQISGMVENLKSYLFDLELTEEELNV